MSAPGGGQVYSQGRLCRPWIKGRTSLSFRHAPSGAEVGFGGRRIPSRGKMPLANDRDPSGVKQKNLSLTTGPQIGNLCLARSLGASQEVAEIQPLLAECRGQRYRRRARFTRTHTRPVCWIHRLRRGYLCSGREGRVFQEGGATPTVEPLPNEVPSTTAPLPMVTLSPMTILVVESPKMIELLPALKLSPIERAPLPGEVMVTPKPVLNVRANRDGLAEVGADGVAPSQTVSDGTRH